MRTFVVAVVAVFLSISAAAQTVQQALPPVSRGSFRTASMAIARRQPTLTTLGDGRVVVIGTQSTSDTSIEILRSFDGDVRRAGERRRRPLDARRGAAQQRSDPDHRRDRPLHRQRHRGLHLYNPADGSVTATDPLDVAREGPTTTLLSDGRVLVAGGRAGATVLNSTDIYDPGLATWSAGPAMTYRRWRHGAVRMSNGDVYVIGGEMNNVNVAGGIERLVSLSPGWPGKRRWRRR